MDFDVTGVHGEPAAASPEATVSVNMDEMVFDVTTTHPGAPVMSAAAPAAPAPTESVLGDLVFDITSNPAPVAPAPAPAQASVAADEGLTFTLDFPSELAASAAPKTAEKPVDIGLGDISLNLEGLTPPSAAATSSEAKSEQWQEVATKLDLAKAYQEMGDAAGAKEILDEVLRDGDEQQRAAAQAMIQQL
jgi:pilus assembly protein FimV